MPDPLLLPDVLERIFHKALSEGDAKGVDASLRLMAVRDPQRAERLLNALRTAVDVATTALREPTDA